MITYVVKPGCRNIYTLMMALFLVLYMWSGGTYAVSSGDFALSVVLDGSPVRELVDVPPSNDFDYVWKKGTNEVALPFHSEYFLRLKNGHGLRATAKIYIDGALVSQLGDIVVPANGKVDLERFLDRSLTEGRRFKFVPLDHPDVDDPSRSENGLVRVEFRLERRPNLLFYTPESGVTIWTEPYPGQWRWQYDSRVPMRFEFKGTVDIPTGTVTDSSNFTI